LEAALKSPYTFRMKDLRRDTRSAVIDLDSPDLISLLASPIRVNGVTAGILLAFGKKGAVGFSELDVFLAERLVEHAAVNLESCYLNQEMRANLKTTQLLYDLGQRIAQASSLADAAGAIALTAFRLMPARQCGLILFADDGQAEAQVAFPTHDPSITHPRALIQQAVNSRQTIYLSESENVSKIAIPIQTMQRCYGVLWMEFDEANEDTRRPADEIHILVNQAAVALERQILLEETQRQKDDISHAYEDLLHVLTKALDTRDEKTEEHSERVTRLAMRLGGELGLTGRELQDLRLGSLLHDIGKIGVPDHILNKPGALDADEWVKMREHPEKGAKMIEEVESLKKALPVIYYHQERWDGSGYPENRRGEEIPLLARIFAVADVFDALTSNRPYRAAISADKALAYLEEQAGKQFDPQVVACFTSMIRQGPTLPVTTATLGTGPLDRMNPVKDLNITEDW
jgi:putative nucleotidyltransferase with HDIG domain